MHSFVCTYDEFNFAVPQVFRLQNPSQWDLYTTQRARIESERKKAFHSDEAESVNRILPLTLKTMEQQLKHEARFKTHTRWANEVYLFHGTKVSGCACCAHAVLEIIMDFYPSSGSAYKLVTSYARN